MKQRSTTQPLLLLVALGIAAGLSPPPASGEEIAATHLAFVKAVKMKKADATLFLPFFDQSRKADSLQRSRQIDCQTTAAGKSGPLTAKGKLRIRLLAEHPGGAPWAGSSVVRTIDGNGAATLYADDVRHLVEESEKAGVVPELFEITFDGGRGKKVATLTVDCLHQGAPS